MQPKTVIQQEVNETGTRETLFSSVETLFYMRYNYLFPGKGIKLRKPIAIIWLTDTVKVQ